MCVLTLAAVRARVIPLRLGIAVAVIGGRRAVRRLLRVRARGAPQARDRMKRMDEPAQGKRPLGRISPASCAREGRYSLNSERWRSTPQCRSPCPQMGESVTEGTVLEWHKQEGDPIEADETLVEISTDKVDAEVPSPASGTVVKIHAAEGDTVRSAPCSPRSPPRTARRPRPRPAPATRADGRRRAEAPRRRAAERRAGRRRRDRRHRHPRGRRVGHRGHDPRVGRQGRRRRRGRPDRRRDLDRQGRHGAARAHRRARSPRSSPRRARRSRSARSSRACRSAPAPPQPARRAVGQRRRRRRGAPRRRRPRRRQGLPGRRARRRRRGRRPRRVAGTGPGGRITKADVLDAKNGDGARRPAPRRAGDGRRQPHAAQGRRGDARPLHGREPLDPDGDLVPHHHRHGDGHAAASSSRTAGQKVSFTHLIAYAIAQAAQHDMPVMAHHFDDERRQAAPRRRRPGQPRHRRRRREEGRHAAR